MDWHAASRRFSLFRVVVWLAVLPLSYLLGWLESVVFVSLVSIYANLASDYAAYRSDVNPEFKELGDKLDELLRRHEA